MGKNLKIQSCFQRFEKKYLLTHSQYAALHDCMSKYLQPDEYSRYTICNVYYDTDNYQLIRASLDKPVYKEKLRVRSYGVPGDGDTVFVELKKKFDGVVYKRRVMMDAAEAASYLSGGQSHSRDGQIFREIDWFIQSYRPAPKVFIAYDREALSGKDGSELRVTFDTNIRWRGSELDLRCGDRGGLLLPETQILMEIKIPGTAPLWLGHLLSELQIFPVSFSKYGICYTRNLIGCIPNTFQKGASYYV